MAQKTRMAVKARELQGRITDMQVHDYIERHPGSTAYEIAKALGWSIGKVQASLERIKDSIRFEEVVEGGRYKKKYYLLKIEEILDMSKF